MPKKVTTWFVLLEHPGGGKYDRLYAGSDRKKARAKAEAALQSKETKGDVVVFRASNITTLCPHDLRAVLPRDAF